MNSSPYNRDSVATFFPDSIRQTGCGVEKTTHEADANRIDFAFLYEIADCV
jgi:hypothetical protein